MEFTIRIDELNNKLKSKFFIVILSNEENLKNVLKIILQVFLRQIMVFGLI